MKHLSIRTRLVLWFSGIVLAGVSLFAVFLYLRFDRILERFLQEHLEHEAQNMMGLLETAPDRPELETLLTRVYGSVDREYDFSLRILDDKRIPLIQSPGLRDGML